MLEREQGCHCPVAGPAWRANLTQQSRAADREAIGMEGEEHGSSHPFYSENTERLNQYKFHLDLLELQIRRCDHRTVIMY